MKRYCLPPHQLQYILELTRNWCGGLIAALFLFCGVLSLAQDWQELKSEHFIIYFTQDEKFAKDVLDKAEVYYRDIASDLGYSRYSEFWTWDKRVKIYIHPDQPSFLKATGQPDWSQGMADYQNKQIVSYAWSKGFLESLLPHEMAHLIFRDFVGFKGEVPLWLDEGVAQWAEKAKRQTVKAMVRQLLKQEAMLSLKDMMSLGLRNIAQSGRVNAFYAQAASLVNFMIEKYGSGSFTDFCRNLRDAKTLEEALSSAYPTGMRNLAELEEKWKKYLEEGD